MRFASHCSNCLVSLLQDRKIYFGILSHSFKAVSQLIVKTLQYFSRGIVGCSADVVAGGIT